MLVNNPTSPRQTSRRHHDNISDDNVSTELNLSAIGSHTDLSAEQIRPHSQHRHTDLLGQSCRAVPMVRLALAADVSAERRPPMIPGMPVRDGRV